MTVTAYFKWLYARLSTKAIKTIMKDKNPEKYYNAYNFKFLFDFSIDVDVVSSNSLDSDESAAVECYFSEDRRVTEV